jgi:hypothetical protein
MAGLPTDRLSVVIPPLPYLSSTSSATSDSRGPCHFVFRISQASISYGIAADQPASEPHLIGVDADFRIHVSDRLLEIHDGPFLELGLKRIAGQMIQLPRRGMDRPDRDRLARRFEEFKKAA